MQPPSGLPRNLFDVREKRDHVVVGHLLDFVDRVGIESFTKPGYLVGGPRRNEAGTFHRAAGGDFDVKPSLVLVFLRPEGLEFGWAIAWNHCGAAKLADGPLLRDHPEVPGFADFYAGVA